MDNTITLSRTVNCNYSGNNQHGAIRMYLIHEYGQILMLFIIELNLLIREVFHLEFDVCELLSHVACITFPSSARGCNPVWIRAKMLL